MLPILRTISVGGVLLAITILALALIPPGGTHRQFTSVAAPARGALIDAGEHPEWRQFLLLAALRRADELNQLRELPDTPVRLPEIPDVAPDYVPAELLQAIAKDAAKTAGLPADQNDASPEDETGSINVAPGATIPIEIGEPSSTELLVVPIDAKPPVIRAPLTERPEPTEAPAAKVSATEKPEQIKPPLETRQRSVRYQRIRATRTSRADVTATPQVAPVQFNLLQAFFDSLFGKPANEPATASMRPVKPTRPAANHTVVQ